MLRIKFSSGRQFSSPKSPTSCSCKTLGVSFKTVLRLLKFDKTPIQNYYMINHLLTALTILSLIQGTYSQTEKKLQNRTDLISTQSNSENLTGIILETNTQLPIPYAHIYNLQKQIGTVADEKGHYELNISKLNPEIDLITISSIGFINKALTTKEIGNSKGVIFLQNDIYKLAEITVKAAEYKTKEIGNLRNPEFGFFSMAPGGQYACWIPNENGYIGFIKSISVFVRNVGTPNAPFMVHLFTRNKVSFSPEQELLKKTIITQAKNGNEWVDINLDSLHINIPKDGFFIGIEWLKNSKDFIVTEQYGNSSITHYGQVIGAITEPLSKGNRTWMKQYLGEWNFQDAEANKNDFKISNVINLSVKAKIDYQKNMFEKEENTSVKYKDFKKRQIKKISDFPQIDLINYPNYSPKTLFESIYKAINQDKIIYTISHLCSFTKEARTEFLVELKNRKGNESWLTEQEKKNALNDFEYYKNNIEKADFKNIDIDKYEITFPNGSSTFIEKKENRWYLMPSFKKIIKGY